VKPGDLHSVKYAIVVSAIFSLFIPTMAYGSAINFDYAVNAKWSNNLNFMICLSNIGEREYEDLFIKAVDEWKARWPHFGYNLSYGSGCHINVFIVNTHSIFTENGEIGYTNIQYWENGAITRADIILPTHLKSTVTKEVKGKTITTEFLEPLSEKQFYRAALHEFGHALNLGHFDDDGREPIDIMHAYPVSDDREQIISQRDVNALNWYYLGFFEQEMTVRTDKKSYQLGDTVNISGKVSNINPGELVRIAVFDSSNRLYASENVKVSVTGTFSYKMKVTNAIEDGIFKVKAYHNNAIAETWFDITNDKIVKIDLAREAVDTNDLGKIGEKVTLLETMIADHSGSTLTSIPSQQQVFVHSLISSNIEQTETTYIILIKDAEGYTLEISSGTYNLISGMSNFSQSWLPESPGKYEIQIFLWKSISNPEPITYTPAALNVTVI